MKIKQICSVLLLLMTGCSIQAETNVEMNKMIKIGSTEDENYLYLNQYLDSFMNDNDSLPSTTRLSDSVVWRVAKGDATVEDSVLKKAEKADAYEKIVLEATINDEVRYTFDNIVLLDAYAGYLLTYFGGPNEDYENVLYAYTYNGTEWYALNNEQPIVEATIGTTKMRDPALIRKKDGGFVLVATEGSNNPNIYVMDTEDLVTYTNERLVQVNRSSDEYTMSEAQAWAPEGFYDRVKDEYIVYWSSPKDHSMFYNMTKDFETFSDPKMLLDTGFDIIDGTIVKEGYDYSIVLKDERQPMETYSQLFVGWSDTDYLNFNHFDMNYITGHQSEGPFVMKRDYDYILYYDDYTRSQFKAQTYYDIRANQFEKYTFELYDVPLTNMKHGYAIPVTWKEIEKVKEAFESGGQ